MMDRVNTAIVDAAGCGAQFPEAKTNLVTRWDAKRELLDDVLELIRTTREERDRILNLRREDENARYNYTAV